jgi:hypothetical protein
MMDFFREVAASRGWQRSALRRILKGKAPHLEVYMLHRIGGKPVEQVEVSGPAGGPIREIRHYFVGLAGPARAALSAQVVDAEAVVAAPEA